MEWAVEYTDQFEAWWDSLSEAEQEDIAAVVTVLEQRGPALRRPLVGTIEGYSMRAGHTASYSRSIRSVARSC
jgi:hypothetical protein